MARNRGLSGPGSHEGISVHPETLSVPEIGTETLLPSDRCPLRPYGPMARAGPCVWYHRPNQCVQLVGSSVDKHNFPSMTIHHLQNTLCPPGSVFSQDKLPQSSLDSTKPLLPSSVSFVMLTAFVVLVINSRNLNTAPDSELAVIQC